MTTIKQLRAKQKEDQITITQALSKSEKAEKQIQEMKLQLKKAQEIEKKNTERLKGMYKIEASNETLRREKDAAQVWNPSLKTKYSLFVIVGLTFYCGRP